MSQLPIWTAPLTNQQCCIRHAMYLFARALRCRRASAVGASPASVHRRGLAGAGDSEPCPPTVAEVAADAAARAAAQMEGV